MSLMCVKQTLDVIKIGSLKKTRIMLLTPVPNISYSLEDLDNSFNIDIFNRIKNDARLTSGGEELAYFLDINLGEIAKNESSILMLL